METVSLTQTGSPGAHVDCAHRTEARDAEAGTERERYGLATVGPAITAPVQGPE